MQTSDVVVRRRRAGGSRKTTWLRIPALILSVMLIGAACTPTEGGGSGSTTPPVSFCNVWDKVNEAPPTVDEAVVVAKDVVAMADETTLTGNSCTSSNATIALDDAVLAQGKEIPSEQNNPSSEKVAAVTGDEIGSGKVVLDNVRISSLSADITAGGIRVKGNVKITLSGTTSTIGFTGTLSNLNNWSVSIASSNFSIPGITTTPATFSGTLTVKNGMASLEMHARATEVRVGDITVQRAELDVLASQKNGVTAHVAGNVKVGPSTASGTVDVVFDRAGGLVSANVDISAHLVGQQADGSMVDLQGSVKLNGNASQTVASFSGSGVVGDLVVHEANGSLTLETNKATFVGVLDVEQGANYVRFNGSIVWDGITAYVPFMSLEGAGQISGTLNDGQKFSVDGSLSAEVIGGQMRTVVTGNFQVGTIKASGSAIVEIDGHTTTLSVDASLVDAGFSASLEGVVQITDGRTELVNLDAGVTGQLNLGDVTLTGASMSIRSSYGNPLDIKFSGGIKVGNRANLSGSLAASIGPNGSLLSLQGSISGSLSLDSWALINFSGSIVATTEQVTVTGAGGIHLNSFPAGITLNGSLTSSLTNPSWSLSGTAKLKLGQLTIASARIKLSKVEGMEATRAGFYVAIIGIPTYLEANFYLKADGGCDHAVLTGGSFLARPIARLVLPDIIGCPVT